MMALASMLRPTTPQVPPRHRCPALSLVAAAGPALPRVTFRELILLRLGDELVRERFLDAWQPVVQTEVRRYAARGGPADDLSGEASLALWEAALQFDAQRHRTTPEQYIQNHIHRRVRRAYREAVGPGRPEMVPAAALELVGQPDERLSAAEQSADLNQAVAHLKPDEQAQFQQYAALALSGMGPDEAARALSTAEGTTFAAAKKRLERLRKKLRAELSRLP